MSEHDTRHIVVGVDGSMSAMQAIRWAASEAARRGSDLRLVHVRPLPLMMPPEDHLMRDLTDHGRKWLSAAREEALNIAPIDVHTQLRTGQAGWELVSETEDAELIVVGSRGLGGFRSLLLGSVANALAAHGHCPIVVLRGRTVGDPAPGEGPVVVGADGTPASADALEFALAATAARGVGVVAVHAWTYEGLVGTGLPAPVDWDEIAAAQHRMFDEQLGTLREAHPGVEVRGVHFRGRPVDGILAQAEDAQLVVVGANGRHPAMAGAVGSTQLRGAPPCDLPGRGGPCGEPANLTAGHQDDQLLEGNPVSVRGSPMTPTRKRVPPAHPGRGVRLCVVVTVDAGGLCIGVDAA